MSDRKKGADIKISCSFGLPCLP